MSNSSEEWSSDELFTVATEGIALTIVSTFGLVGNVMSVYVLAKMIARVGQGSFSVLLLGLACFDALFLLTAILAFGLTKLWPWYSSVVFPPVMAVLFGLVHTFRVGSVYVTLSINLERFCAIVFPLRHFSWKKYLLPTAIAVAILYNVPKYFEMEMRLDPATNTTEMFETDLRKNSLYVLLYVVWSKILLMELLPYCAIVVCNVFIIVKITKSARFRSKFQSTGASGGYDADDAEDYSPPTRNGHGHGLGHGHGIQRGQKSFRRKQKEEHHLGLILVLMSILFIICQSFKIVPDVYELIFCGSSEDSCDEMAHGAINVVLRMSHLLVCFNSSANFLVYYLSGRKFRTAWMEAYGCDGADRAGHNAADNLNMAQLHNETVFDDALLSRSDNSQRARGSAPRPGQPSSTSTSPHWLSANATADFVVETTNSNASVKSILKRNRDAFNA